MKSFELLSQVTEALYKSKSLNDSINQILQLTGSYMDVSRTYVFIDSQDGTYTSNTHEWCNTGVKPQKEELQKTAYKDIPSWKFILENEGRIFSENIEQLPDDLRVVLEPQNVKSIIIYPLIIEAQIKGFVGFDECLHHRNWNDAELNLLQIVAGYLSILYEKTRLHNVLVRSERNLKDFFDTIDDLIVVGTQSGQIIHTNEATRKRLGYSEQELYEMDILELHPPDKRKDADAIVQDMLQRKLKTCPLELKRKNGSLLPVETRVWLGTWDGQKCIFGMSKDLSSEQEALQKFTKIFENNPAMMTISNLESGELININDAFLKATCFQRNEILESDRYNFDIFFKPETKQKIFKILKKNGKIRDLEVEILCKKQGIINGLFNGDIIESQGKKFFLSVIVNITEHKKLQLALSTQTIRLSHIIDATEQGTWEWNIQTGETFFNEQWAKISGYTLDELQPTNIDTWKQLAHPDDLVKSDELLKKHFEKKLDFYDFECRVQHKSGQWRWVHDRGKVIQWGDNGEPLRMFGTHSDITENKILQEKIRTLSIRDSLTGIYNRRYLFDRMNSLLHESSRNDFLFSLAMIDIDHFKSLNDTYGHLAGDYILKAFTTIISENIRPYDILARYGGEEFIILLLNIDKDVARKKIDELLAIVRNEIFIFEKDKIQFTFSGGVADVKEIDLSLINPEQLVQLADDRLYEAKNSGRNRIVSTSS